MKSQILKSVIPPKSEENELIEWIEFENKYTLIINPRVGL